MAAEGEAQRRCRRANTEQRYIYGVTARTQLCEGTDQTQRAHRNTRTRAQGGAETERELRQCGAGTA